MQSPKTRGSQKIIKNCIGTKNVDVACHKLNKL